MLKPISCEDHIAVDAMRRCAETMDDWKGTARGRIAKHATLTVVRRVMMEETMPVVMKRLVETGHPYAREVEMLANSLSEYPLELYEQVRCLVHFEYTDDNGEEARV